MKSTLDHAIRTIEQASIGELCQRFGLTTSDLLVLLTARGLQSSIERAKPQNSTTKARRQRHADKAAKTIKAVNTRTKAGRTRYEGSILAFLRLQTSRVKVGAVRQNCGGSPDQARKALNRLIDLGLVDFEGVARATAYGVSTA